MTCSKIILAGTFSFPYGTAAASRIRNLAIGFSKASEAKVKVISLGINQGELDVESDKFVIGGEELVYTGVVKHQVYNSNILKRIKARFVFLTNLVSLRNLILSELSGKDDEVLFLYGRSFIFLGILLRGLKNKKYKTKLVFDVVEPPRETTGMLEYVKRPFLLDSVLVFNFLLPKFHACTFITHSLMRIYGGKAQSSLVVPSVVYQQSDNFAEEVDFKPGSRIEIGYVGSLLSKDFPKLLFEFIEELHARSFDFRLTILGRFNNFPEGRLWKNKFINAPFSPSIRLVSNPDELEKNIVLQELHFLVMFRKPDYLQQFTFPTRVVEYIGLGKSLIINQFGDFEHYFNDDNTIVVTEDRVSDSVGRFIKVIEEGQTFHLSRKCRSLLTSHFNPVVMGKKLLNTLYQDELIG